MNSTCATHSAPIARSVRAGTPVCRLDELHRNGHNGKGFRFSEPPILHDRNRGINAGTMPALAAITEFVLIAIATFVAGTLYHEFTFGHFPFAQFYLGAAFVLSALFVVPCGVGRQYSIKYLLDPKGQMRAVLVHWNSAYSLFVFALFMVYATDFYSRGSILAQYAAGLGTALAVRLIATWFVASGLESGRVRGKNVILVGEAERIKATAQRLRTDARGVEIVGMFAVPQSSAPEGASDALDSVKELSRRIAIDDIVIELPWSDDNRIRALVEELAVVPATVHLAPDYAWTWARHPVLARVGRVYTMRLARAPLTVRDRVVKRAFDIVGASLLLLFAAPLFLLIAAAIKLEGSGPVFFRQRRHGFNQREFRVFKFRTMTTLDDGPVVPQATRGDARITKVGRLLRSTNLDETPQLFNVLLGQMSLVGPRPHAVAHNDEYEERIRAYAQRHKVKPGITGLAQVNGYRGITDTIDKMLRRVEQDLFYIDNWSLRLDLKILFMTLFSPRSYRNAY